MSASKGLSCCPDMRREDALSRFSRTDSASVLSTASNSPRPIDFCVPIDRRTFQHMILNSSSCKKMKRIESSMSCSPISQEVIYSQAQVVSAANDIMAGKPLAIEDAQAVAGIVEELNLRRIEALRKNDYKTGESLLGSMKKVREEYRLQERNYHHKNEISRKRAIHKEAIGALNSHKEDWKQKIGDMEARHKADSDDLKQRQLEEQREFEQFWTDPNNTRFFTHRSASLLEGHAVEKNMLLTEKYEDANSQRKFNIQMEKKEVEEQERRLRSSYETNKAQLIQKQSMISEKLRIEQEMERKLMNEKEKNDLEVKKKRVEATKVDLDDEKLINFVAKKYHNVPTKAVPPTVSTLAGMQDLPALAHGGTAPPGFDTFLEIRKSTMVPPLQVPNIQTRSGTESRSRRRKL